MNGSFLDPVRFYGEGQYNLHSLKEIIVTDSFMGLERDARNCQNMETYNDCITSQYIEKIRNKCDCLPLSLNNITAKVKILAPTIGAQEVALSVCPFVTFMNYENHDIAIAMSPSRADPVLPWLGVFKYLKQSHCTDWGHLNI